VVEVKIKVFEPIDEDEYECPNPAEPSTILFQIEYVDGDDWDIYEIQYEGGAAEYENSYGCGLDYTLKEIFSVKDDGLVEGEWYVIEGFTIHFYRTGYWEEEIDCDFNFTKFRAASIYDRLYFGV
jgi:hypothetical protein